MELKDFIKESLVQIADGINEANKSLEDSNAIVNPKGILAYSESRKAYGRIKEDYIDKESLVEIVEFDVAVQAESGTETGGGIKLSIASIGVGTNASSQNSKSTESRIKFQIPMIYPTI